MCEPLTQTTCTCDERYRCPDGSCALEHAEKGGMSLRAVARVMGVSQQHVSNIERAALAKVRKRLPRGWRP